MEATTRAKSMEEEQQVVVVEDSTKTSTTMISTTTKIRLVKLPRVSAAVTPRKIQKHLAILP